MIPPAGECVWGCGSGQPFNCEHIIGKQFAKAIEMPFPVPITWGEVERSTGAEIEHGQALEKELAICTDDRVCKRCNSQWMKRLDDLTVRAMRPALKDGEPVELDTKKQLIVSRWATKVALLLTLWFYDQPPNPRSLRNRPIYVPADNFHRLYARSKGLPENTSVWIGAMDPTQLLPSECSIMAEGIHHAPSREPAGYYSVFQLRRVLFFVCGFSLNYDVSLADSLHPEQCTRDGRAMQRLWPSSTSVVEWPPPAYLQTDDQDRVVQLQPYGS